MERNGSLNRMAVCGKFGFLMMILFVGLLFSFIALMLVYCTYQAVIGAMVFCTLWIDIPGRLAIFMICYYAAGMCGYFPLPERYRLELFPEPFMLWRFQSWRQLFRNLCYSTPSTNLINRLYINAIERNDSSETSLFHGEYEERFYECDPIIRRRSAPVRINYPDSYVSYDYISPSEPIGNESPDLSKNGDEPFMSFDSSICGQIVPMVKGKSSKRRYLSDNSKPVQESSKTMTTEQNKSPIRTTKNKPDDGGAAKDSVTEAKANEQISETATSDRQEKQKENNPQISEDAGYPIYPRFPWGFLRIPGGMPQIARKIHKRNLKFETREIERYSKEQKQKTELERFSELMESHLLVKREAESKEIRNIDTIRASNHTARDIGAPTGARSQNELFAITGNVDHTVNPLDGKQREIERNIVAEGDSVMTESNTGFLTGARPRCGLFTSTGSVDATENPLDVKQRAKNIDADSTVNRRRQLPSQRFASKNRSCSHCRNRAREKNRQKNKVEKQEKDDYNISETRSGASEFEHMKQEFKSKMLSTEDAIRQKKSIKKAKAKSMEHVRWLYLKKQQRMAKKYPQSDTDIPTISEDQDNFDKKLAVQTIEIANKSIDTPVTPTNSNHSKTPENPHYETSITSPTDTPKKDRDLNSKDFQKL